ncbi:MAG: 30S ribosomal protein S12 methylthiotransferase RimO [Thermoplasmata archaeon]|nr:MAG: 30S ribosomal protein S12 methylthiotransferase RimO [Thermoplasmata archaeon]
MNPKHEKIFLVSLGCAKNLVDSENMLGLLGQAGFWFAAEPAGADVAVINTCGFLQSAVEEAIDTILEVVDLKRKGNLKRVVVSGCMVQRYGHKLRKEIPEVDAWLGTAAIPKIVEAVESAARSGAGQFYLSRPNYLADHTVPRVRTTPFYTSYLKIAEGCSHHCSYCMIPRLRGPYRSRPMDSLLCEAEEMVAAGVREINLVAQDTTFYGNDSGGECSLEDLLQKLATVEGLQWIRLLYCHPDRISDRLLTLLESEEKICPYLDVPFQHVNPEILRVMKRPVQKESPHELIRRIQSMNRKIYLRTTVMVGFPGETRTMFQELFEFIEEMRFYHLGVFAFSPEKGTAAYRLESRVDPRVAAERRALLLERQAIVSLEMNDNLVNTVLPVLVEGEYEETPLLLSGRTAAMAPDVDGRVLINRGRGIPGEIMPVRITEAHPYDLIGEIVDGPDTELF